jgi:hypothetical protein
MAPVLVFVKTTLSGGHTANESLIVKAETGLGKIWM